jgi:hypothetical protein
MSAGMSVSSKVAPSSCRRGSKKEDYGAGEGGELEAGL